MHSTAAKYFTSAVKSDVFHLIMVCWVFLLQLLGAAQSGHTKWPKMCSCLRRKQAHINTFLMHPRPQQSIDSCHVLIASLKYSAFMQPGMVNWCGCFGDEQC